MSAFPDYVYKFMLGMGIFIIFVGSIIALSGIYESVSLENAILVPQLPQEANFLDYILYPFQYIGWLFELSSVDLGIALINILIVGSVSIIGTMVLIEIVLVIYPF